MIKSHWAPGLKCSYLRCFGQFTYFHEQLVDRFRDAPCYSVSFDECMNKISQNEQMDFIVGYWDSDTGQDSVRCIGSEFLGLATAADLLTHFKDGIKELDPKRLLHGCTQWVWTGSSTLFWHENAKLRHSRTYERRQLKSHGNSLNCHGKVMELYYQISVGTLYFTAQIKMT